MARPKTRIDPTPTLPASMPTPRANALSLIAAKRNLRSSVEAKVTVSTLVATAIENFYGSEIDSVLLENGYAACEECGVIGGCEHTFRKELP